MRLDLILFYILPEQENIEPLRVIWLVSLGNSINVLYKTLQQSVLLTEMVPDRVPLGSQEPLTI